MAPLKQAQESDPSKCKLKALLRRLRGVLGQSRVAPGGDGHVAKDSRLPSGPEDRTTSPSLWGRAYDVLRDKESDLVREYEELLLKEAQRTNSASDNDLQPDNRNTDTKPQQAQLEGIITRGLQRIEERKTKYTIAGHEFVLSDQIAQAGQFVLWAKDLIGEAVKQSPQASIAWAGVCIVLPLLTNPVTAREANRDGFAYVTTRMRYYVELESLFGRVGRNATVTRALIVQVENSIVELYCEILEFQIRSVLRFYQNAFGRYVGDLTGTVDWEQKRQNIEKFEGTVDANLRQITQLASQEELKSISNTSSEALKVMRRFLSISENQLHVAEEHLAIARRGLEIQEDEVKNKLSEKQIECLQLFRLTSSTKDATYEWYKDRVEDRVGGTCEWFLNHENYQRWLEQDSGPLLVSADPGCGKSVLAKYLVDCGLPGSSTICYFFFKDQDQDTACQALCALLHQLFLQKPSLIKHATDQYDRDGKGMVDSKRSLWTILDNAIRDSEAGTVIIVLDALDECAESEFGDLVSNIERQFSSGRSSSGKFKYILTSRPYDQIVSKFQHLLGTFPYIRIPGEEESDAISQEVNYVIRYRVDKLAAEKKLSPEIKRHLEERLLEIEHRTYLWVYLVFDYLKGESFKKTKKGIDTIIATLPKSVNQAYEQILSKSKEEERPTVRKALSIILVACRPLTVSEMNVALSIESTSKSLSDLDLEEEEDFKSRLRSWCGLFVSIHHGKIYFLHQTAREFLFQVQPPAIMPSKSYWQHSTTSRSAHGVLAEICVLYLKFLNSGADPTDVFSEARQPLHSNILLDYAAKHWGTHFLEADVSDDADIVSSAVEICKPNSKSCLMWFRIYRRARSSAPAKPPSGLFIASYLGHEAVR
ncbi:hypothetical protein O1611_g7637 [Lasiodiplodia mahajangana]|uniref:Uncharacterized protein n=1 Tax=Lasiodiplodia mahajangana TaxID=1108764 RepID=A0ACC2JEZ3_9PEZI|nr:hypothetical protein O1611_g7637 [Lasiodiplodia mahajangana]